MNSEKLAPSIQDLMVLPKPWVMQENEDGAVDITRNIEGRSGLTKGLVDKSRFFANLRRIFKIKKIYYPGGGNDTTLERTFDVNGIFYLDKVYGDGYRNFHIIGTHNEKTLYRRLFANSYSRSPFRDGAFDALYFEDNHSEPEEFKLMLDTLKLGGLVIMGDACSGEMDRTELENWPGLKRVNLPFTATDYNRDNLLVYMKPPTIAVLNPINI